jgi:hypothetical protein
MSIAPNETELYQNESSSITGFFKLPVKNLTPYTPLKPMPYGVMRHVIIKSCPALFGDAVFNVVLPQERIEQLNTETVCDVALEFGDAIIRAGIKIDEKWIPAFFEQDTTKKLA